MNAIHEAASPSGPISGKAVLAVRIISGIVILFLLADGAMKLVPITPVTDTMAQLGWPGDAEMARTLGILTILCTLLYAFPQTSILGAILLTGYLGGAMATHLRVGSPLFTHLLFGFYLGLMVWGSLYLRDARLRALIPFRR
jgi:DoxX-like family